MVAVRLFCKNMYVLMQKLMIRKRNLAQRIMDTSYSQTQGKKSVAILAQAILIPQLDKPYASRPNLGDRPEPSGNALKSWETARNVVGHTDSEGFNGRWLPQLLLVAENGALPSHMQAGAWG